MNKRSIAVGLMLSGVIPLVGSLFPFGSPSHAVTLNDFEINAEKNTVKIILHTDERTNYTTETNGKHFSILLYDTQLSSDKSKTPVSSDAKHKWTGKASSVEGDKVRITLPNLSPNQYAISVIQKPGAKVSTTPAPAAEPAERQSRSALKPRSAFDMSSDDALEAIVNRFQDKKETRGVGYEMPTATVADSAEGTVLPKSRAGRSSRIKSARAARNTQSLKVAKTPKRQEKLTRVATVAAKPHIEKAKPNVAKAKPVAKPQAQEGEAYNALTMAEPDSKSAPMTEFKYKSETPVVPLSAPAATTADAAPDRLAPPIPQKVQEAPLPVEPVSEGAGDNNPQALLMSFLHKIPSWVLWAVGLLTIVGSLFVGFRIVRFLFSLLNANRAEQHQVVPSGMYSAAGDGFAAETAPSFNTVPFSFDFQDTTRVNGTEYLMNSQDDIQEAVKNTLLLKFSSGAGAVKHKRKIQNSLLQRKTGTPF